MPRDRNTAKVIVIGDAGVGKKALVHRLVYDRPPPQQHVSAIGCDWLTKHVTVHGQPLTLQFWMPNGQERFGALPRIWYRDVDCCLVVYDVNKPASVENMPRWKAEALRGCKQQHADLSPDGFPCIVVGNKIDGKEGTEGAVSGEQVREFCQEQGGLQSFRVSAMDGTGAQELLDVVAQVAFEQKRLGDWSDVDEKGVSVGEDKPPGACF